MFEVGIKSAKEELEKIKREFQDAQGDLSKLLKVKVSIEGIDTITRALSQIGDTTALRNLRSEVEALNKEFVILSKGAGGEGSIASRGIQQQIEQTRQSLERYNQQLKDLTEQRSKLVGGKMNRNYGNLTTDMEQTQMRIDGANSAIKRLEEQLANLGSSTRASVAPVDEAILQLKQHIDALASSRMTINLGGDFAKWTEQVQALVVQIKELVEQYKQLAKPVSAAGDNGVLKSQTEDTKKLAEAKEQLATGTKKAADAQASDEGTNKITNTYERFLKLLVDIENEMAKIGKIQAFGEQSGFSPTILKQAVEQFEKLKTVVDATIKGKPIAEGLAIPMTPEQLSQFVAQFALLRSSYKDIVSEADKFNKQSERDFTAAQKSVQTEIDKTIAKLRALDEAIKRGEASGRDMSVMSDARSKLQGQLNILQKMTASDYSDSRLVEKRIKNIQQLREDTELLRKAEEKLTSAQERNNKAKDKADTKALNDEIKSVNDAWIKYNELSQKIRELRELHSRGFMASIDLTQIESAIARYLELRNVMREIINNNGRTTRGNLTAQVWGDHNTKKSMQDAVAETKSFKQALTDVEKRMNKAGSTAENLGKYIDTLQAKRVDFKGLDTTRFDTAIQRIRDIRAELERFSQTGQSSNGVNANEIVRKMGLAAAKKEVSDATAQLNSQLRKNAQEAKEASSATSRLTSEEERLASAMKSANNTMHGQSQVLSDLKSMAMQYMSVWGAQSFISNIIEIGGQLEKQRLSIGAILGDMSHANDLFGKIKNLAVQSPFGVVELDQYTKQLSAYGFKYNELYDMTKRLADISAGAGTDVSRLTLALGHVRSEGALTGYTLRQFAMNNIPMLSQLAKKLSEVEHRVVTAADVRKRVRNKEIGYEDVVDVIKNLTNEGGMFYNMQETISQSIQSRFKNLKDSLDIMYGEIAESKIGDALKELAVILTNLSRSWKTFVPIVESAAMSWAVYKAAMVSVNMAMGTNTAIVTKNILAYKKKRAEELQHEAMVRKLTAEEMQLVRTRNQLTASNIRVAMSTGAMTKGEALKLVALRKVNLETTKALIQMGAFSAAEARTALQGKLLYMNLGKVGASIKLIAQSAWTGIKGLAGSIFTPLNAAFAALTLGMSAKGRQDEIDDLRRSRREAIREQANEGYKNLQEATRNFAVGASENMTKTDINLTLDDMIEKLKEYSTLYNSTFNEAFKTDEQGYSVHSLAEQYEILAKSIQDASNAHKMFAEMSDLVAHALEVTNPSNGFFYNVGHILAGWALSDNQKAQIGGLNEALERYATTTKEASTAESLLLREHLALRAALDNRGLGDVMGMSNDELVRTLSRLRSTMPETFAAVRLALGAESRAMLDDWTAKCNAMNEAYANANLKMRRSGNDLYESMKTKYGEDMTKWPTEWREFVMMAMNAATKDVKGFADLSIEYQNLVRDSFLKPFNITVDSDEAKERVNDLYTDLQNLVGKKWVIQVGVKGESAWEDLETSGKKFTENDKKVKQLEKNLKRLNYKPGSYLNSREAEKVAEEYNEAIAERRAAKLLYEKYGGDVSELDKSKNKKSGSRKGTTMDQDARRLREIVKLYKDAYDWYVKYEKQIGEGAALTKVQGQFKPLFKEFEDQFKQKLSLDSIPKYKDNLTALLAEAEKLYKSPKHKNSYMVEAIKQIRDAINNVDYEELGRKQERFLSKTQIELDNLTRSWDMFNKVREATGNVDLAVQLSGAEYQAGKTQNLADAIREKIQKDFASVGAVPIPFDINLSDEQIGDAIKAAMPKASEDQIKGFVEEYKKWRDLQRDVEQKDRETFSSLIGSAVDLQSELRKISDEYLKIVQSLDRMKAKGQISGSQYNQAKAVADANMQMKTVQAQNEFKFLMDGVVTLSKKAAQTIRRDYVSALQKQLAKGAITAKDYADRLEEINNKMRDLENAPGYARSYMEGGLNGIFENMMNRGKSMTQQGASMFQQGMQEMSSMKIGGKNFQMPNFQKMIQGQGMEKMGASMMQGAQGAMGAVAIIDTIIHGINDSVQALKGIFDEVREMFDALGHDVETDSWQDANTFFSTFSKASQHATNGWNSLKNGNIGGAILGTVGSITSWFTGFAQGHDSKREKHIQDLKKDVQRIDNTLLQERSLGYDRGEMRKILSGIYDSQKRTSAKLGILTVDNSPATAAMKEYYARNWGYGNGYQQELESMKQQREDYIRMYNEEDDKKKSSAETLEEFQSKIAELDEQILFFVEDLANELWGIDFKSWADQISDALWTAFENGEDALEAFHDTAKDIIADVAKKMMNIHLVEPVFQELEDTLFGKLDTNGQRTGGVAYNMRTGEFNEMETMKVLGKFFSDEGPFAHAIKQAEDFYDMAKKAAGVDFASEDSSKSTGTSIKGITEQTADLLASYVNACRASASNIENMTAQYFPMFYQTITSSNASLTSIQQHTAAIMRSNDSIAQSVSELQSDIRGLRNKAWKVPMA